MLRAIQPMTAKRSWRTVRGQYGAGRSRRRVPGYRRSAASRPIPHRDLRGAEAPDRQLALGRRAVLPAHRQGARRGRTEIAIQFKRAPFVLFSGTPVER